MSSQLQLATNGFESTRLEFDLWPTSPPCAEARRVPGCKGLWSMCGQSRSYPGCPCQQPWREPTRLFWWLIHKTPMWTYNSLQEGQNPTDSPRNSTKAHARTNPMDGLVGRMAHELKLSFSSHKSLGPVQLDGIKKTRQTPVVLQKPHKL